MSNYQPPDTSDTEANRTTGGHYNPGGAYSQQQAIGVARARNPMILEPAFLQPGTPYPSSGANQGGDSMSPMLGHPSQFHSMSSDHHSRANLQGFPSQMIVPQGYQRVPTPLPFPMHASPSATMRTNQLAPRNEDVHWNSKSTGGHSDVPPSNESIPEATQPRKLKRKAASGKRKKGDNSDEEIERVLTQKEQLSAGIQIPLAQDEATGGTHWKNDEMKAMAEYMIAPERVDQITVDASRFLKEIISKKIVTGRDLPACRNKWNQMLKLYKDVKGLEKHTGGGDGNAGREAKNEENEVDSTNGKSKKKSAADKFAESIAYKIMNKGLGGRVDIEPALLLQGNGPDAGKTPSSEAPSDDEDALGPNRKKQQTQEFPISDMFETVKQSAANSKRVAEIQQKQLDIQADQLKEVRRREDREDERYKYEKEHEARKEVMSEFNNRQTRINNKHAQAMLELSIDILRDAALVKLEKLAKEQEKLDEDIHKYETDKS